MSPPMQNKAQQKPTKDTEYFISECLTSHTKNKLILLIYIDYVPFTSAKIHKVFDEGCLYYN